MRVNKIYLKASFVSFLIHAFIILYSLDFFYYEINISCPNTKTGQSLADQHEQLNTLIKTLRSQTKRVISIKISPDQSNHDLKQLADIICQYEKMVINAGNTSYRSCEAVNLSKHAISRGGGGLSGPSLFPRTLELISLFKDFNCFVIATGGIHCADNVNASLERGASLVGMATALVMNPFIIPKILQKIRIKKR